MKKILFICTGNTCRSPMAEALLKARMPESWRGVVEVSSAGTHALEGQPAAMTAVEVLQDEDIDLSAHRSRRLTGGLASSADLLVVMTEEHARILLELDPAADGKMLRLGVLDSERGSADIDDPIGGDRTVYAASRDELDRLINRLISYISDKFNIEK